MAIWSSTPKVAPNKGSQIKSPNASKRSKQNPQSDDGYEPPSPTDHADRKRYNPITSFFRFLYFAVKSMVLILTRVTRRLVKVVVRLTLRVLYHTVFFVVGAVVATLVFTAYDTEKEATSLQLVSEMSTLHADAELSGDMLQGKLATVVRKRSLTALPAEDLDQATLWAACIATQWALRLWIPAMRPFILSGVEYTVYYATILAAHAEVYFEMFKTQAAKYSPVLYHYSSIVAAFVYVRVKAVAKIAWNHFKLTAATHTGLEDERSLIALALLLGTATLIILTVLRVLYRRAYLTRAKAQGRQRVMSMYEKLRHTKQMIFKFVFSAANNFSYYCRLAVPHLLYGVLSFGALSLLPDQFSALAQFTPLLIAISFVLPVIFSFRALANGTNYAAIERWLTYWAAYACLVLLQATPLLGSARKMPLASELYLILLGWMVLPWTQGGRPLLFVVGPLYGATSASEARPSLDAVVALPPQVLASLSMLSRFLQMTRVLSFLALSPDTLDHLRKRCKGLVLLSAIFFVTPGFITYYGVLMAGFLQPLLESLSAPAADKKGWLSYWLGYNLFRVLYAYFTRGSIIFWFLPVVHVELLLTLYLNVMGGAEAFVGFVVHLASALVSAHRSIRPKEAKKES